LRQIEPQPFWGQIIARNCVTSVDSQYQDLIRSQYSNPTITTTFHCQKTFEI
jgi:hypothetical protein